MRMPHPRTALAETPMHYPPNELATRLAVLSQNVLAMEAYMVRLADLVADTKQQLEELRTGRVAPARGRHLRGHAVQCYT